MKGIKLLLDEKGVFVSESHYLMDLIDKLEYDAIYHEHLRYYGLRQLSILFKKYGIEIFDVERIPTHGGSLRVYSCFKDSFIIKDSVKKLLKKEDQRKLHSILTLKIFAKAVKENKKKLRKLLLDLKSKNKQIVGVSAPARSCTILNYCEINSKILDYITEKSTLKIGKYTPGTHIPVVDDKKLIEDQPDYALLWSWHLKESIVPKLRKDGFKGEFIIPLPEPIVI